MGMSEVKIFLRSQLEAKPVPAIAFSPNCWDYKVRSWISAEDTPEYLF